MPAGRFCHRVVIVGAGLSGLALAYRLERRGVRPRLLEAAPRIAEPWRRRHPQLRLNTHRHFSRLPGRPLPRSAGVFAGRDSVIRYLEAYARDLASPIEFGVSVSRIEPGDDGWCLETNVDEIKARHVVVATGRERVPVIPDWPGREGFHGRVRHAADFGSLDDYRDRRVLVVGAGNSGVDVLNHLVRQRTRRLWVAVRGGTAILPKRLLGVPVQRLSGVISCLPTAVADGLLAMTERIAFGDLRRLGLPRGEIGAATRLARRGVAPAIDDGFVRALEGGSATVVPGVVAFEPRAVVLEDGRRLRPDIVICATGYRPGLEGLVGHLKVLDDRGIPRCQGAESLPGLPGLWFLGMQPRLFGQFQAACRDSRKLARCLLRS
ncbi:NAD(P)/FAD-dependent oxidoreductase [Halomonas sp. MCCC 1A17488]|uniref:flavin-containing monooxygenase n=1 Tax=unclassified Halomonas TaxID=2609666 RepID=UPI0018D25F51|nr:MULTISPECIES: NAD(P)/FAD-dependent oxidoreductase [unclassified Halomonas]MCE8015276.1 NAD(P)/FAD-dependent oxidoreductase [Halomonas sp. MCCC 1A17488]MCG3238609.1 NAD(P)/FAD-dependent oxidoreductase [Halomonas sp. MCCC 1A17488]QPP51413.1 NAD(P)/FAD-dependent oxidoreductase [Halomonas sp. SS10-MC5]